MLGRRPAGDGLGVYCLARIQNYRGGWQLYMTLNRSLSIEPRGTPQ